MTKAKFSQLKKFFSQFPTKKLAKGAFLYRPGDKIENIHFLKSGYIRVYSKNASGENTINAFKPAFITSIIHFFTEARNDFFFEAITPIEVYLIPQKDFKQFLGRNPDISSLIMDYFCHSLLRFIKNQGSIVNGSAIGKVACVLYQLANDYGEIQAEQLIVHFPATHRIIANLVGLTRETTSVQMSKLQKLGVISTKRSHYIVKSLEKLKRLAFPGDLLP